MAILRIGPRDWSAWLYFALSRKSDGVDARVFFAFDQRFEGKDAHDLIYCIEHAPEGIDAVAGAFRTERDGKHGTVVETSLAILRSRFAGGEKTEGYCKDGPVSVAKFELGEGEDPELREARALRQRQASDVVEQLLARLG